MLQMKKCAAENQNKNSHNKHVANTETMQSHKHTNPENKYVFVPVIHFVLFILDFQKLFFNLHCFWSCSTFLQMEMFSAVECSIQGATSGNLKCLLRRNLCKSLTQHQLKIITWPLENFNRRLFHLYSYFRSPLRRSSGRFTSVWLSWSWWTNSIAVWPGRTELMPPASLKSWSTRGTRGGTACRGGWLLFCADSRWDEEEILNYSRYLQLCWKLHLTAAKDW